ncbi:MAG: NAD(P)-dependent alcohol dehydrogenase [Phycisphaerales bacterium]|nr:NAD(P)-dependent alcohol dehydrogenase [Phycisphaerales bacterium]
MKAVVFDRYGPPEVLKIKEVETPEPRDNEIQVQIRASTIVVGDCEFRSFRFPWWFWVPLRLYSGVLKPKRVRVLGQDLAGIVTKLGKDVQNFSIGDQIVAAPEVQMGGHAEFACLNVEKKAVSKLPDNVRFEDASTLPTGGLNALHYIRKARIEKGDRVLIVGAAGSIGSFAVQLAKDSGALVTGVDRSDKLDMLLSIGADKVIDYEREDFTQNGTQYDVIFDAVGKSSYSKSLRSLNENGRYILANPHVSQMVRGFARSMFHKKKVFFQFASYRGTDLDELVRKCSEQRIQASIDRVFPIKEIVSAHSYVDSGDKIGHVVIRISESDFKTTGSFHRDP